MTSSPSKFSAAPLGLEIILLPNSQLKLRAIFKHAIGAWQRRPANAITKPTRFSAVLNGARVSSPATDANASERFELRSTVGWQCDCAAAGTAALRRRKPHHHLFR
jgi:hypothetical protein